MSLLKGLLTIYAFAVLWGILSGLALVAIRYFWGSLLDGYMLAIPLTLGLGLSIVVLWVADYIRSRRLTFAQHLALVLALVVYCALGAALVIIPRTYPWYDLSTHQIGLPYFSYYLILDIGHGIIFLGIVFYILNLHFGKRTTKPQFDPSGRWLGEFVLCPIREILYRSVGFGPVLFLAVLFGLFSIAFEKQEPLHNSGASVLGLVIAVCLSWSVFRYVGLMRAHRLLLYSLEKTSIEALALAGEMDRELDPDKPRAIKQHIKLCNRFDERLEIRIYLYPVQLQYQTYSLFLQSLLAKGQEAHREYLKISNVLRNAKHDSTRVAQAVTLATGIYTDLHKLGDRLSFADLTLNSQRGPDLGKSIDDLREFLDDVERDNRRDFAAAEETCLRTRGVWLEQLPSLLDLNVDRSELLEQLNKALARAHRSMKIIFDSLAHALSMADTDPSGKRAQDVEKLKHYLDNVQRRQRAVEALRKNDKHAFLELIKPGSLNLGGRSDNSNNSRIYRFLIRLFPIDPSPKSQGSFGGISPSVYTPSVHGEISGS